jgi:vacuolar-type H+-ATPase subunit I/STV1
MSRKKAEMEDAQKRIVEINGIKMEVDLRQCKVIEHYKVGDQIKILVKEYDKYQSYPGVIIGFDDFRNKPSIVIAYLKTGYDTEVKFVTFHEGLEDYEIAPLNELDKFFSKSEAVEKLQYKIDTKEQELKELEQKKKYFESTFHEYFEKTEV